MAEARDLVFPIVSNARLLEWYLLRRVPPEAEGKQRRAAMLTVEVIETLWRCEKIARSLYVPSYDGL